MIPRISLRQALADPALLGGVLDGESWKPWHTGLGCHRIEIVSVNGRRVIVDCDVDVESLLRIMRGLETLP